MPHYQVKPDVGNDANDGLTESSAKKTLSSLGGVNGILKPGDSVTVHPGTINGALIWGGDEYLKATDVPPLTINFLPGAILRGGITDPVWAKGQGLRLERWNGIVINGLEAVDGIDGNNGCGILAVYCKNLGIYDSKISNWQFWGIHISHCHGVVIKGGWTIQSRREHGIYVGNSSSNVLIDGIYSLRNEKIAFHNNGDGTNHPDPTTGLPFTGVVRNLEIRNCVAGWNGGPAYHFDATQDGNIHDNILIPTPDTKGNGIALFNLIKDSPEPTKNMLFERNKIICGPSMYNVIVVGGGNEYGKPQNITLRDNDLIHTGWTPGNAKAMMEVFMGSPPVENITFENNRLSHNVAVINDSTLTTLAEVGVTLVGNTILAQAEVAAIVDGLPEVTDPGAIIPPPSPPPPPRDPNDWLAVRIDATIDPPIYPLFELPATAPEPSSVDPSLVDLGGRGKLWLRAWKGFDLFSNSYVASVLHNPLQSEGIFDPFLPDLGLVKYNHSLRWAGFIQPHRTGVYDLRAYLHGTFEVSFFGELLVSNNTASTHDSRGGGRVVTLRADRFYAVDIGLAMPGDYGVVKLAYRGDDEPGIYKRWGLGWFYPPVGIAPSPPVPPSPSPPVPPVVPPPSPSPPVVPPPPSTDPVLTLTQVKELLRAMKGN